MAYVCEISAGRTLYLDNENGLTAITISSASAGQQQQASSRFQTGEWKSIPEVYLTSDGAVVKLQTAQGVHYIRVQGSSVGVSEALSLDTLNQMEMQKVAGDSSNASPSHSPIPPMQPMPPMQLMRPMQPMSPMSMGDMQMTRNPMQMKMGNMEMQLGSPPAIGTAPVVRRFCSQCGGAVKSGDRFCSSCGHKLGE